MLYLKLALRVMLRLRLKSIIVLSVSLLLVLFVNVYTSTIEQHIQTVNELHANIEVIGYFTDFNMDRTSDLRIKEDIIWQLEGSGFIAQRYYTRNLIYLREPWDQDKVMRILPGLEQAPRLVGVNDLAAIPDRVHQQLPEFLDGYNEGLFHGGAMVCLVSTSFLSNNGYSLGDELELTIVEYSHHYHPQGTGIRNGTVTLKVVGVYDSTQAGSQIYCPWDTMTDLYADLGLPLAWDSARFTLKNTANLSDFRSMLRAWGFNRIGQNEKDINVEMPGFVIQDRILNSAVNSVQNYINYMTLLFPVIYILCAGISFLVSYLLIRLRKAEYAVMRSLGTSQGGNFMVFFWEQAILSLAGSSLGIIFTWAVTGTVTVLQNYSVLGYIISYWIGAASAILALNQSNVIQILTAKE